MAEIMLGKNVAAGQRDVIHVSGLLSVPEQIFDLCLV